MVKSLTTTLDDLSNLAKVHSEDSQLSNSLASSNIQSVNQTSAASTNATSTNVVKLLSNLSSMIVNTILLFLA